MTYPPPDDRSTTQIVAEFIEVLLIALAMLLLALVIASCKPHIIIPKKVAVIDESAIKHTNSIKRVLDEYNAQHETPIFEIIEREPRNGEWVVRFAITSDGWGEAGGGARINGNTIYVDPGMKTSWSELSLVWTHEVGHSLCICHSDNPNNVMYTSTQKAPHTLEQSVADVLYLISKGGNCPDPMAWADPYCAYLLGQTFKEP